MKTAATPTASATKSSIETVYALDAALRAAAWKAHQADLSTRGHQDLLLAEGRAFQAMAAANGWDWLELKGALQAHAVTIATAARAAA
jgi:hypothetical protein